MAAQSPDECPSESPALERAQNAVDEAAAMLRVAAALVASGRRVDLTGLDAEIGRLCGALLDLPGDMGRTMRPLLVGLLADLDRLAIAIAAP